MMLQTNNSFIENLPWAIITFDRNLQIVKLNADKQSSLGWFENADLVFLHNFNWVNQAGEPVSSEAHPVNQCFKTGKAVLRTILGLKRHSKDDYIWIEVQCFPEFEKGDTVPTGVIAVFSEVAGEKADKDQKLNSEEKCRTLFDFMPNGYYRCTPEGYFLDANNAYLKMLGYDSLEELRNLYSSEDFYLRKDERDEISSENPKDNNEIETYRLRKKNGDIIWIEDNVRYTRGEDGKLRYYEGICRDISDRKLAENTWQHREILLNEMGRIARIGGWELDCTTMQQVWTDETYAIHDRDKKIYIPNSAEELSRFEPGSKELIERAFELALTKGEPYDLEVEMTTIKGTRKWVRAVCSPFIDEGKVTKLTGTVQDITERKQAEMVLRDSETRFATLFKLNPSPVGITSAPDFRIVDVNEAWCRLTGYSREEVIGHTSAELALVGSGTLQQIRGVLKEQSKISPFEITLQTRSGQERQVVMSSEQIEIDGNIFFINTLSDITELKQADINKIIALAKYKALFDNFPMGITVSDKNGNIIETNATAEKMLGISIKEQNKRQLSGKEWQIIRPDGTPMPAEEYASVRALTKGQKVENVEMGILKPDNSVIWLNVTAAPIMLEDYGVVVTYHDITERRQIDKQLAKLAERLNLATQSAGIGIWDWDIQKNEIVWDKKMVALYGLKPGEFKGAYEAWLNGVHPDDREESNRISLNAVQGECEYNTEFRVLWPDGSVHWLKADGTFIRDINGTAVRMVGVNYDITERKLAEKELKWEKEKLDKIAFSVPGIICTFHKNLSGQYSIPFASYAAKEVYGLDPEDISTDITSIFSRIFPEDVEHVFATISQSAQTMGVWKDEYRYLHPVKGLIWIEGQSMPVKEPDGSITWHGFIADITERKNSEQKLLESEKKYHDLIDSMNDTILVIDNDLSILDVNYAATFVLGYSKEELLSMKVPELDNNLGSEQIRNLTGKMQSDKLQVFETTHRTKNGRYIPVEVSSSRVTYDGKTVIMCIARDITERKLAEKNLKRWADIFENVNFGFVTGEPENKNLGLINTAFARMHGYTVSELTGVPIAQVFAPEFRNELPIHIKMVHEKGHHTWECMHIRKDGTTFPVLIEGVAVKDKNGKILYRIVSVQDITERKQAEEKLE